MTWRIITKYLKNPEYRKDLIFRTLIVLFKYKILNKKTFIKLQYLVKANKRCNIKNPRTFNEKLQWLKLNNINLTNVRLVDKVKCKEYIKEKLGEEFVVPTLGIWDKVEDIQLDKLPSRYFIKCNHGSGRLFTFYIDKTTPIEPVLNQLRTSLKINYYYHGAEYHYKYITPKIIAEEYLFENSQPIDFKAYCFNGNPRIIYVGINFLNNRKINFYNEKWEILDLKWKYPHFEDSILPPLDIRNKFLRYAKELSKEHLFIRVDGYIVSNKIYIGELTFFLVPVI